MGQSENTEKLALQAFLALLLMSISGYFGYRFGHSYSSKKEWADREPSSECLRDGRGLGAYSSNSQDFRDPNGPNAEYLAALKRNHLEERDSKISMLFPASDLGRYFTQVLTLYEFGDTGTTPESRILVDGLKELESQPWDSLSVIRLALKRMGPELSAERMFLMDLGNRLDLNSTEKVNFFMEELVRSPSETGAKATQMTNALALAYLMQLGDPNTVETGVKQTLASPTIPYSLKSLLLGIYEAKYPDEGKRIRDQQGF